MKKIMIFGLTMFVLASSLVVSVHGQNIDGQNLSVFPAIQEELVKPGEKTRVQIQFKNGASTALVGKLKVVDFTVSDKQGTPKIIENGDLSSKYGAASWISLSSESIAIPPNDFVSVDLGVNVPDNVSTCAKYALVYIEPVAQTFNIGAAAQRPETATSVSTRLGGILIFNLDNNGNCKEDLNISGFTIPKFQEYGPVKVNFDVFNLSDYHIVPAGYANISNLFGAPVDQQTLSEQRIFPEAAKSYQVQLGSKWMFGRYKVLLNAASNGLHSVAREQVAYVWVFPWRVALVTILTIIVIILLIKSIYKRFVTKETGLEEELKEEQEEIDKLKSQLKKRG